MASLGPRPPSVQAQHGNILLGRTDQGPAQGKGKLTLPLMGELWGWLGMDSCNLSHSCRYCLTGSTRVAPLPTISLIPFISSGL